LVTRNGTSNFPEEQMESLKPKHSGSKLLFENSLLERLSRTHISIPVTIFSLYALALLYWSYTHTMLMMGVVIALFFSGLLLFTWIEYQVHRRLFHMDTMTAFRKRLQYVIHGVHHEFPKDKDRLAMPPVLSVTIATSLLFVFSLILGDMAFSFLAGFLVGYAAYLLVHYMVHVFHPPKNFFKALWVNHSVHHYKHGEAVFGVSSPLWDYIYGTMDKREKKGAEVVVEKIQ